MASNEEILLAAEKNAIYIAKLENQVVTLQEELANTNQMCDEVCTILALITELHPNTMVKIIRRRFNEKYPKKTNHPNDSKPENPNAGGDQSSSPHNH